MDHIIYYFSKSPLLISEDVYSIYPPAPSSCVFSLLLALNLSLWWWYIVHYLCEHTAFYLCLSSWHHCCVFFCYSIYCPRKRWCLLYLVAELLQLVLRWYYCKIFFCCFEIYIIIFIILRYSSKCMYYFKITLQWIHT